MIHSGEGTDLILFITTNAENLLEPTEQFIVHLCGLSRGTVDVVQHDLVAHRAFNILSHQPTKNEALRRSLVVTTNC